jgi:hypothetical protein
MIGLDIGMRESWTEWLRHTLKTQFISRRTTKLFMGAMPLETI